MGKPQNKVKIKWSPEFAYAIGLLTTDGNLSPDGRHFDFTSVDIEQLENFKKCLGIKNKIGIKIAGYKPRKVTHLQFGDVNFYRFLLGIGLSTKKSKTLGALDIPDKYFFDFLRGHFDGDGTFYSYFDPRWKSSFMFYTCFISASKKHLSWLRTKLFSKLKVRGHITKSANNPTLYLKYAKKESMIIFPKMYSRKHKICLSRKYLKIKYALGIVGKQGLI